MNLSTLKPKEGSHKTAIRKGRGNGSNRGKTSGRGHKGSGARKSSGIPAQFEGGQMPLQKRVPKRGFNSKFPNDIQIVSLNDLEKKCDTHVTNEELFKMGLIKKINKPVKILGTGKLTKSLQVKVSKYSKSAKEAIEAAKGTAEVA